MNEDEKLTIAHQLAKLKVDVIEAGFPVSSPIQFNAVRRVAEEVSQDAESPTVAALARAVPQDIQSAYEAIQPAFKKRIHTFIATSDIHMKHKLGKAPKDVLEIAVSSVKQARYLVDDVEFSAEDATRSHPDFLIEIVEAVIEAGASTINLPDTVGYTTPHEYGLLFKTLKQKVKNIDHVVLSAHCHNDLGLAVANSLAALQNGARQIECTINGIGERAGNTAMEEIVMAIKTRSQVYPFELRIDTQAIYKASKMVANFSGLSVQRNKAIVGGNAFAHESGIHQDGMLKNKLTYEIMTPESIGLNGSHIVLGRHSGRAGFKSKIKELGFDLNPEQIQKVYDRFLEIADQKKEIFEEDIMALLNEELALKERKDFLQLDSFSIQTSSKKESQATVTIRLLKENTDDTITDSVDSEKEKTETATGDGPIAALFSAIEKASDTKTELELFNILPTSKGKDSLGEARVGLNISGSVFHGRGLSTDIVEASAKAFLDALNKFFESQRSPQLHQEKIRDGV